MAFPRRLVRIAVLLGLAGGGDGAIAVDGELRAPAVRPGVVALLPGVPGTAPELDVATLASEAPSRIVAAVVPPVGMFDASSGEEAGAAARDGEPAQPDAADLSLVELRAAAMLVSRGTVDRVTLSGFRVWPGLMAESTEISRAAGVRIVPAVTRTGGQVDFIVTRDEAPLG